MGLIPIARSRTRDNPIALTPLTYENRPGEKSLRNTTDGINLDEGDAGITPQAGVEILQRGMHKIQSAIDALEDLARPDAMPPSALRRE